MGFVNDVINCECLGCVIYFRIKEKEREKKKKKTHSISTFIL